MGSCLPSKRHGTCRSMFGLLAVAVLVTLATAKHSTKAVCKYTTDCDGHDHHCIDNRCMCSPLWAHTGSSCNDLTWTSWGLVIGVGTVGVLSVVVLSSAANGLSTTSSHCCSGVLVLTRILFQRQEEEDSGTTTVRAVVVSAVVDLIRNLWKMLTALGLFSDTTGTYWHARALFPLSEGFMVLPAAIVVSVWMDVANSSMSRSKSKKRLERTKRALQFGTALYIILLVLMSVFGHQDLAMVVQLGAIGVGMTAYGSGAAKLCNTLRNMGASSAAIADTVFHVSRAMGISLYILFIGNTMILSSRTRKSNPANLALCGVLVSSLAKCFLNKAIIEYMVESRRARKARLIASAERRMMASGADKQRPHLGALKPAVRLISSLQSIRKAKINKIASEEQQRSDIVASEEQQRSDILATNILNYSSRSAAPKLPPIKDRAQVKNSEGSISSTGVPEPNMIAMETVEAKESPKDQD